MSTPSAYVAPASEGSFRHQHSARYRATTLLSNLAKYGALVLLSCFFILPWVWMISTSLKNPNELAIWPPIWIPDPVRWDNYISAFRQALFSQYVVNTLIVALPSVAGAVLSNTLVAYGFARVRWPGRDAVFAVVLATMILPGFVTFIPLYIIFTRIGWVNTYMPLVVPAWLGNAFFIFLLRQFFMGLPQELSDAARVDGASDIGIFWRIILPLSQPIVITVMIQSFLYHWNDFLAPLIYLNSEQNKTLALGLAQVLSYPAGGQGRWEVLMAAATITLLPCVVIFFIGQKFFIQGVVLTGIKG